jgi:large subunit ribosomal protein L15
MNLSNLKPPAGQVHRKKRVGQGMGSGKGKFSTRGAKGARSISGYSIMRGFEGGQMPLHRRLPKRGFSNADFKKEYAVIHLGKLDTLDGKKLQDGLKILGTGELTRAVHITAHHFSDTAKQKIEAAGGTVTIIAARAKFLRVKKERPAAKPKDV